MLKSMHTLYQHWKATQDRAGKFYGSANHRCDGKRCCLHTLVLYRRLNGAMTLNETRQVLRRDEACIAVCAQTGQPHYCGAGICQETIETPGGDIVCRLTGSVLTQGRVALGRYGDVDSTTPTSYVARQVKEMTTDVIFERAVQISGRAKFSRPTNKREFLAQVLVLVTSVFSRERFEAEYQRHHEHNAFIQSEIEKYISRCNTKQEFPDILHLTALVARLRRRMEYAMSLRLQEEPLKRLSNGYATLVTTLWHVLRTKAAAAGGQRVATVASLREFVLATLETCQTGLSICARDRSYEVEIVPLDPIMQLLPMTAAAQEIVLGKTKNLSRIRKNIKSVLQLAVDDCGVNPEELRLVAYEFEGLEETAFSGL